MCIKFKLSSKATWSNNTNRIKMKYSSSQLAISVKKVYSIPYIMLLKRGRNNVLHNYDKRTVAEGICVANRAF